MHTEFYTYYNTLINRIIETPNFIQQVNERFDGNTENLGTIVQSLITEMQGDYIKKNPPMRLGNAFLKSEKEVVLNKGQVIYKP